MRASVESRLTSFLLIGGILAEYFRKPAEFHRNLLGLLPGGGTRIYGAESGATIMAYIPYHSEDQIPEADRVSDRDNIIRVHAVHSRVMRQHYDLYVELMRGPGPLTRIQRELIAVVVSTINACHY
jgi:hypothetical protein